MTALICGSYAYDNIMVFPDRFKNHILPDKVHMLNVSFLVPEMRREFGGCAGNIMYNLKLLGGKGLPMATVGNDFAAYASWIDRCGIDRTHITVLDRSFTGQAYITTDMDDNQITAFHPGAMTDSHLNKVSDAVDISIGIVSPDGREGMIAHAQQFSDAGIPFLFDPGQGLPMFDGSELLAFIDQANWVAVNDYEAQLLQDRTGLSPHEIAERVEALFITRGAKGSQIYTHEHELNIPPASVEAIVDPTGCGDAYRAGLLFGLMNNMELATTGRIASLCGAIKIEQPGTQNHSFTMEQFKQRYHKTFGEHLLHD
jgi:adenosine kinase